MRSASKHRIGGDAGFAGRAVLHRRAGQRPKTTDTLPHLQLDQWPPAPVFDQLVEESLRIPAVRIRESRMASVGTVALALSEEAAGGPSEAFIDDYEFCHIHPLPDGSIHMTLPPAFRRRVVRLGWGEEHAVTRSGILSDTLTLVYAPRTAKELKVVLVLIEFSSHFAKGMLFKEVTKVLAETKKWEE